jgi:hypothetical protein
MTSSFAASSGLIGIVVLFPTAAFLLVAAFWAEFGQQLLGLAELACASCADPSNGIDPAGAAAGAAAAGAAAGGAAAGDRTGGADEPTGSEPWTPRPTRDARTPDPSDDAGDQTPWESLPPRPPDAWYEDRRLIEATDWLQEWAEKWVGVDRKGTAPASKA